MINAKPELEIYADDVKCAHGATFGQLDRTTRCSTCARAAFPKPKRAALLTWTFAFEVLENIRHEDVRSRVAKRLLRQLPGGEQIEALQ